MNSKIVLAGRFEVFEDGNINRIQDGKSLPATVTWTCRDKKYGVVCFYENKQQKRAYIHRIVASAFIPNPNNLPEVNHKDGNTRNNAVSNLEWVTRSQNAIHAYATGLAMQKAFAEPCECCGAFTQAKDRICRACKRKISSTANAIQKEAKLNDRFAALDTSCMTPTEQAYISLRAEGKTLTEIADMFHVSRQCVGAAILHAEQKANRPSKMSRADENFFISLKIKAKKKEDALNSAKAKMQVALMEYQSSKEALESFMSTHKKEDVLSVERYQN